MNVKCFCLLLTMLIVSFDILGGGVEPPKMPEEPMGPAVEIFIESKNLPASPIMSFSLIAQSPRWGIIYPLVHTIPISEDFYLTSNFNNPSYVPPGNNITGGFDFVSDQNSGYEVYGFGLYKVVNNLNDRYFYLDFRDSHYGCYMQTVGYTYGAPTDIMIRYDGSTGVEKFLLSAGGGTPYNEISDGQLVRIWELKQVGLPVTNLFPNYWANALGVISSSSGNPRLVWGPNPSIEATNYKIYRAISAIPLSNPEGSMNLIASVGGNSFDYIDNDVVLHSGGNYVYYYVKAYNSGVYSDRTNIVNVNAYLYKETIFKDNKQLLDFRLDQNYPNPFNPSTKIKISVPSQGGVDRIQDQHVKLVVYDIMGKKIKTLINKHLQPGVYEIEFDASDLPSGVYFYTLNTESNVITKKMTLIR